MNELGEKEEVKEEVDNRLQIEYVRLNTEIDDSALHMCHSEIRPCNPLMEINTPPPRIF